MTVTLGNRHFYLVNERRARAGELGPYDDRKGPRRGAGVPSAFAQHQRKGKAPGGFLGGLLANY